MKKSSKLLLVLSLLGLGSGVLASCSTNASNVIIPGKINEGTETAASYNIVNASSEAAYLDGLPEKGVAHQSYSFRVSLKPGYHFNDKLSITSGETNVAYTFKDSYYTFEMPEADVAITLDTGRTDFTIKSTSYFVSNVYLDQEGEEKVIARSALPGTALKFEAHPDEDFEFSAITLNGKALEEREDGFYHFTMPTRPAIISSDKIAVKYNVTMASELTLSTATIYTNAETKTPITQAVKGDKVYIAFAPNEADAQLKFTVTVKTVAEEGESAQTLTVTEAEDNASLFSFEMVSKNVEITVKEKDISLYAKSELVGKAWKGYEVYGTGDKFETKTYDGLDTAFTFNLDESCLQKGSSYNTYNMTWTPDGVKEATLAYETSRFSNTGKATLSEQILSIQYINNYSSAESVWTDAYFCLPDDTYDLHVYSFNKKDRLVWAENPETHQIVDAIFIDEGGVLTTGITIKKEDASEAIGTDITKTSHFFIYKGEEKLMEVSSGSIIVASSIEKELEDYVTCTVKDENGNEITSSVNGKTITVTVGLVANAPANLAVKAPDVRLVDGTAVKVTKDETTEGVYTFTMPSKAVTIKVATKDLTRYQGYAPLGTYTAYEIYAYGEHSKDYDFSSSTLDTSTWNLKTSGDIEVSAKNHLTGDIGDVENYEISSIENTASGTISIVDNSGPAPKTSEIQYDNGLMITPFTFGSEYRNDFYLGVRLPEGKTESDIKTNVQYKAQGIVSSWAVSVFVGDELFGSVFCYRGTVYMGVTFTFDEGSTRIGADSSYHVVKDGQTIFDVVNNEFTPHNAN